MDINQYLEIFIEEAQEHLQSLNHNLLDLELNPNDSNLLNEIFRSAHTLKGMAGTMGYNSIMNLTHEMENILDLIRNGKLKINSEILDILFECLDFLEESIGYVSENGKEIDKSIEPLKKKLIFIIDGNSCTDSIGLNVEDNKNKLNFAFNQYDENLIGQAFIRGMRVFKIEIILSKHCMLKSARAFIVFKNLEKYSDVFKSYPAIEDIEDEKFDNSFKLAIITSESISNIKADLQSISEIEKVVIEEVKEVAQKEESTPNEVTVTLEEVKEDSEEIHAKKNKIGKTVRVDIDRLDNLMNLVSELIIIKTRLEGVDSDSQDQNLTEAVEYLERITTNLHDAVMKVRMVPIERVFSRFPRMVRDLSRDLDKEIVFNISGEETELDRTVIDEIGDPLIHLIRNAIDHGIEDQHERLNSKKSSTGTIALRAFQDGNSVVIEVEDDGKGINVSKVKKKAVEKRLISQADVDSLNEREAIDLLFRPGFSTADKVSDLSGRGVGLDVVKTKIESLGGTVEVETSQNNGSKFTIRLPLTLAIIQALLVNIGNEKYAIPLNSIKEITAIERNNIKNVQGQEVVLYRDSVLPIVKLAKILEVENCEENVNEFTVVIAKKGEKNSGFIVDSLIGQQEIVIKSLGKYLVGIKNIAGATILGDGQVALIIDTNSLI